MGNLLAAQSTAASRRRLLKSAGAVVALGALRPFMAAAAANADVTGRLARYMVAARDRALPDVVDSACKHRILDTFGAMVSGARMRAGTLVTDYVRRLGGTEEATVVASGLRTSAVNAALANAMCAHADETDDFEPVTKAHPGCSAVPAALAMAEKNGASGAAFIRAVALGYDVGCRLLMALGPDLVRNTHRSAEGNRVPAPAAGGRVIIRRSEISLGLQNHRCCCSCSLVRGHHNTHKPGLLARRIEIAGSHRPKFCQEIARGNCRRILNRAGQSTALTEKTLFPSVSFKVCCLRGHTT